MNSEVHFFLDLCSNKNVLFSVNLDLLGNLSNFIGRN